MQRDCGRPPIPRKDPGDKPEEAPLLSNHPYVDKVYSDANFILLKLLQGTIVLDCLAHAYKAPLCVHYMGLFIVYNISPPLS